MRKALAPIAVLAAQAGAVVIPVDVASASHQAPVAASEITFKASNGSDVILNIGKGFAMVEDMRSSSSPALAKHIKIEPAKGYAELCTIRATKRAGAGMPRRDDCQALHDYVKAHNALVYFEDHDADLARWAEVFWVGTCAFRSQTFNRNVVFSNADVTRFLESALNRRAWTVDGRLSASSEADCAVVDGELGWAPMFWRLQERAATESLAGDNALDIRDAKALGPLVVKTADMIPKDTSAYIMNDRIPIDTNLAALANVTASNSTLANTTASDTTLAKRFLLTTDGDMEGPYCKPTWLTSSWSESNIPRKVDCERLAKFVQNNSARVKFKDRDVGYWAKFAAHGTCGIMFKTTKPGIVVTNRDMLRFVDNVIRWEECNTDDGGVTGKMGVWCILDGSRPIHNGEFSLFWRNPNLPSGELDRRDIDIDAETFKTPDYSNIKLVEANATEPKAPTDDPAHVTWVDVAVLDKNGNNATFQVNGNVRSEVKTLGGKSEQVITPLGPSKRCNGKTIWMGGAHKDSALIEDCKTLMIYIREHRKFWMFNADEVRAARDGDLTPIIKYQTCHFAYGPRYFSVIGNMDIERLLEGAIEHLDNTHGRMRGWGNIGCDLEEQFGNKAHGAWQIYP
ncbi:hypothetical protein COL922a_009702 [Colletotrichum nupharicola]|nr:hypothetical protein COL922a_009702 [Colletotrichum nupharicola]